MFSGSILSLPGELVFHFFIYIKSFNCFRGKSVLSQELLTYNPEITGLLRIVDFKRFPVPGTVGTVGRRAPFD